MARSSTLFVAALVVAAVVHPAVAITTLTQGDIALIQYGSQAGMDKLRFVTLVDLDAGTKFSVTDRGWNTQFELTAGTIPTGADPSTVTGFEDQSAFTSTVSAATGESVGEGTLTYEAPTALPAGSLITFCEGEANVGWTGSPGNLFEKAGDQVIVFRENPSKQPCFIWAWTNTNGGGFDDQYMTVDSTGVSPGTLPVFVKGTAKDNEIDSDYPRNYKDPEAMAWGIMNGQPEPGHAASLSDDGAFACGVPGAAGLTWPELPNDGSFVYTGPVGGTKGNLLDALSDPLYFSSEEGPTAPAEITSPFDIDPTASAGTVFASGEVAPLEVLTGSPGSFRVVFLTSYDAGTILYASDRGFDDSGDFIVQKDIDGQLVPGDGTIRWTAPSGGLPGSIVEFTGPNADWTVVEGSFELSTGGDQLVLYQFDLDGELVIIGMLQMGAFTGFAGTNAESDMPPGAPATVVLPKATPAAPRLYYQANNIYIGISGRPNDLSTNIYNPVEWATTVPAPLVSAITVETALAAGDVRVTRIVSSYDDVVDVLLLESIVAGTRIYMSDVGLDTGGASFASPPQVNDGTLVFLADTDYAAGSVLHFVEGPPMSAQWQATEVHNGASPAKFMLNPSGDQVHLFQSDGVTPDYLSSLTFKSRYDDPSADTLGLTDAPTGLPTTHIMAINGADLSYKGPSSGTKSDMALSMVNPAFWDSTGSGPYLTSATVADPGTTVLSPGDVVLTAVQTDGDPELSIMNLVPILTGTMLFITDMPVADGSTGEFYILTTEFSGTQSMEGVLRFTATADIPTGTVISTTAGGMTPPGTPGVWAAIRGSIKLNGLLGDQLFVFQAHTFAAVGHPPVARFPSFLWGMDWTSDVMVRGTNIPIGDAAVGGFRATDGRALDTVLMAESLVPDALLDGGSALVFGVALPRLAFAANRYEEYVYLGGSTAPSCNAQFCNGGFAVQSGTRAVLLADFRQATVLTDADTGYAGVVAGNTKNDKGHWGYSTVVGAASFTTPTSYDIQTTLHPGDVVVVNADGSGSTDSFQIMFLVSAVEGTVVEVTDTGAHVTDFQKTDGKLRETLLVYTVPAGGVTPGTVVDSSMFTVDTANSNQLTLTLDFVTGDQVIVFQRAAGTGLKQYTFLHAVHVHKSAWDMGRPSEVKSRTLATEMDHYVLMLAGSEAIEFRGPTSGSALGLAAAFANPRFWFSGASSQITTLATNSLYSVTATSDPQPTPLTSGDIAIVRVESSPSSEFDVLLLKDLAGGTSFYVTAMDLNGPSALSAAGTQSETNPGGTVKYTAPAGSIPRGTVLSYPGAEWDTVEAGFLIDDNVLHVFQYDLGLGDDTDAVPDIQEDREVGLWFWTDDSQAGLAAHSTDLLTDQDNYMYRGPLAGDQPGLIAAVQNHVFWYGVSTGSLTEVPAFTVSDIPPAPVSVLGANSVAFVNVNTVGGSTSFRVLIMDDIVAGTSFCVTDNNFAPAFAGYDTDAADGCVCFTAQAAVSKGTIVGFDGTVDPAWTETERELVLDLADETLTLFQYDMTEVQPVQLLASFQSLTGTCPVPASSALVKTALVQAGDNWVYRGPLTGTPDLLAMLIEMDLFWYTEAATLFPELAAASGSVLASDVAPTTDVTPGLAGIVRLQFSDVGAATTTEFDFVLLEAVAAGTCIYATDHEFLPVPAQFVPSAVDPTDGVLKWTAPAALAAGTIVSYPASPGWDVIQGDFVLEDDVAGATFGEAAALFQVDATAGSLLAAPLEILFYIDSSDEKSASVVPADVDGSASVLLSGSGTALHWTYSGPTVGSVSAISTSIQQPELFWVGFDASSPPAGHSAYTIGAGSTSNLQPGDVAVVRVQSGGGPATDEIQFVFLTAVNAGTELFITDAGWKDTGSTAEFFLSPGDGFLRYTVPGGGLPANSVVTWEATSPAAEFDELSPLDLASSDDQVLLFARTGDDFEFLWMWDRGNGPEATDGDVVGAANSQIPAGLAFSTFLFPLSPTGHAVYRGPTHGSIATVQAALANHVYWFQDATTAEPDLASSDFHVGTAAPGTAMTAGDVAVIKVNSVGAANEFTLVALCELAAGTQFFLTDHGWTGSDFFEQPASDPADVEGVLKFETTVVVPTGTVFDSTDPRFSVVSGTFDLNNVGGDQLFLFQVPDTTPTFSWGWDNTGAWEPLAADVLTESDSVLPSGLGLQSSITLLFSAAYEYTGPTDGPKNVLRSAIAQGTPIPAPSGGRRLFTLFWSNLPPNALPPIFNVNAVLTVSQLEPGCVAVVAFDAMSDQGFTLLLLDEIGPETEIYVTDNGFVSNSGAGFTNAGLDGMIKYTAPATMPAGTLIHWNSISPPPTWSVVQPGFAPSTYDQLLVFQFYNSPLPTFVWAFDTTAAWEAPGSITDLSDQQLSELPLAAEFSTKLTPTVGAAQYSGINNAPTSGTKADLIAAIGNPNFWQVSPSGGYPLLAPGNLTVETALTACNVTVIAFLPGTAVQLATLVEVAAGTRIKVTSKGWDETALQFFATGGPEGTVEYTFPADTPPGTFITIDLTAEAWPLTTGDSILVYQGEETDGPPSFLWAYANTPFSAVQGTGTTTLPAALADGQCYTLNLATTNGAVFDGPATGEPSFFVSAVGDPSNWFEGSSPLSGGFVVQQQTLAPGCVAVVNFHSHEVLDQLQLLVLDTMASGATFFVTDAGWSASGFVTHEHDCVLRFTAPGVIPAGTVLTWTESDAVGNAAAGWTSLDCTSDFKLTNEGESILIYHANLATPREPETFLWGFRNSIPQAWDTGSPPSLDPTDENLEKFSNLPDALIEFNTALQHFDDYIYKGPMCGDKSVLVAAIRNPIFWFGDNSGDTAMTITGSQFAPDAFTVGPCSTTNLQEGCVAVVEYQADADPGAATPTSLFRLVLLDDVQAGTILFVTDGGYDSDDNTFFLGDDPSTSDTDGMLRYTFPTDMAAGSIVSWDSVSAQPNWEKCGEGVFALNTGGDQLFVFAAHTPTLPNFLFALDTTREDGVNNAGWEADIVTTDTFESELPVGLAAELSLSVDYTNWVYRGHTSGSKTTLLNAIVSSLGGDDQSEVFWFGSTTPVAAAHQLPASFVMTAEAMQKLNPGEVAVVEYDFDVTGDNCVGFAIILLVDAVAGTQLYVTDKPWNGGLKVDELAGAIDEGAVRLTLTTDVKKGRTFYYPARPGYPQPDGVWTSTDEHFEPSDGGQLLVFQWRPEDMGATYLWAYLHAVSDDLFVLPPELGPGLPGTQWFTVDDSSAPHRQFELAVNEILTGSMLGFFIATLPSGAGGWVSVGATAYLPASTRVQTTLAPGDIAVVSYRPAQDGAGERTTAYFQVLLLVDICKGTQFIVTDKGHVSGSGFPFTFKPAMPETDGYIVYQAQSDLPAGTVLTYTGCVGDTPSTEYHSWMNLNSALSDVYADSTLLPTLGAFRVVGVPPLPISLLPGDQLTIFQFTLSDDTIGDAFDPVCVKFENQVGFFPMPYKLLWVLDATDDGFEASASATSETESELPADLALFSLETGSDLFAGRYVGTTFGDKEVIVAAIRDLANWESGDATECVNTEVCQLSAATFPLNVDIVACNGDRVCKEFTLFGAITDDTTTTLVTVDWGDFSTPTSIATSAMAPGPSGSTIRYFSATHDYAAAGDFTIVVTGVDALPAADPTATKVVTIAGPDVPSIALDPIAPVDETSPSAISGVVTSAGTPVLTVEVDFGDGAKETVAVSQVDGTFSASHTYDNDGSYTVEVSGEGSCGTGSASGAANVNNVKPTLTLTMPSAIPQYGSVVLMGCATDINPNDDLTFLTIMWGDGSTDTFDLSTVNPTLTFDFSTGKFSATHMYSSPTPATTFTIQAVVQDDGHAQVRRRELAQSDIASTSVDTVPECSVGGGLVLNFPLDCDMLQFDALSGAELLELMTQLTAYLTTGTPVVLNPHQFVVMSLICSPAPQGSSDVIISFKLMGVADDDALTLATVLASPSVATNTAPVPLLPFTITGGFGEPVITCPLCDDACLTCTDIGTGDCTACADGYMLADEAGPAACIPEPSTTSSSTPSPSASNTGTESVSSSATPSASYGSVGGGVGAAGVQEGADAPEPNAPSTTPQPSVSSTVTNTPSASTMTLPSETKTPSASEAPPAGSLGGEQAAAPSGDGSAGGEDSESDHTVLVAALGGGAVVGVVVVIVAGVMYVRAKRRGAPVPLPPARRTQGISRRRNNHTAPTAPPSTLWRVMHTPPPREPAAPAVGASPV